MAKTLDKSKKRKLVKSKNTNNNNNKKQKKNLNQPESSTTPYSSSTSSSSSDSSDSESDHREFDPEELRDLLQPYSKEQLVDLICSSSSKIGSSVYSAVLEAADRDVTHRKIFVYGLPWETTRDGLFAVFEGYGEIEECTVVIDKVTGKAKGFGFVTFKSRKGAKEALKEPKKRILNRTATCQLAAMGPAGKGQDMGPGPVKISLGQSQQQQQQQVFNGVGGGMAATPFMMGNNQYHPVYGGGMMMGNPGLAVAGGGGGGYMYPMLASALGQMGGIGGDPGLSAALGSYFGGQSLPTAYSDPDAIGKRGSGKDSDAAGGGGGSFNGYSNY
ncbi:UBP1-associated proteins 1A [Hirschfeldia incana]|nr:UBP1-associated proteins 1A [Hirschfeldia incana]